MGSWLKTAQEYSQLLDSYDTWLFDCDGVLWRGDRILDGTVEVLDMLRRKGKKIVFVTNNASKSRQNYRKKFEQLGIEAHVDEIYGSAFAAAVYVSSVLNIPKDKKVYIIGMSGLEEEFHDEGYKTLGGTNPGDNTLAPFDLGTFELDPDVAAVVCGLDTQINYTKLCKAFQYLTRVPGCHFVATNEDGTYPTSAGILPGAGSLVSTLRYALNRNPIVTGKPANTMLDCIKAKVHFNPARTIMVGDRLNTDILFGQNGGLGTLLVLTGVATAEDITGPNASTVVPKFVTQSLADLRAAERA